MSERPGPDGLPTAWALGVLAWTAAIGLPSLAWPHGRDQGIYAYTAWRWLNGADLYADVYTFKPPGSVWMHAASQLLLGPDMAAIRALDLGLQALSAAGLAWLVAHWTRSPRAGLVAGLLMGPSWLAFGEWHAAQTDGWFAPFVVGALCLTTRTDGGRWGLAVLAGLLVGMAAVLKYTALAFVLPVALPLLALPRAEGLRGAIGLAFATPVPLGLTFGAMGLSGTWPAFLDAQRMVLDYTGRTRPDAPWSATLVWVLAKMPGLRVARLGQLGVLFVPALLEGADARVRLGVAVWASWLVAAIASMAAQGRYFDYHALPLVPPLAWSGGVLVDLLLTRFVPRRLAVPAIAGVVLVTLAVAAPPRVWTHAVASLTDRPAALEAFRGEDPRGVGPFVELATRIRELSGPDEPVLVWSYDPVILFLGQRRQVSRFPYTYPMVVAWQDGSARQELLDALDVDPPRVVVVTTGDAAPWVTGTPDDSAASFDGFPALRAWVEARYERLPDVRGHRVWVRRPVNPE